MFGNFFTDCFQVNIFMITGHFSPAKRPAWFSNKFSFFSFLLIASCQYFLDNWTLLSLQINLPRRSIQNVIWDKIHQKCETSKDLTVQQRNLNFKASLSRWVGVGDDGLRKALDTLDKVPDWQAANFDFDNVSSNRGIFFKEKRETGWRERKKINTQITPCRCVTPADGQNILALSTKS